MENIRLSPNFTLAELVKSNIADRHGINNWPTDPDTVEKLRLVAMNILQPVRDHFGIPFSPTSGFRCLELNRIIGSKDTSQHTKGQAVDFEVPGISNYELSLWISRNLSFDQLILEFYEKGQPNSGWVHCSYVSPEDNRKETLTMLKGEGFVKGLVE